MRSKITKFAAAIAIILALCLILQIPGNFVSTAYALQDTIQAFNAIRWVHIRQTNSFENRKSDFWLGYNEIGNITRIRYQSDTEAGDIIGPSILVGDDKSCEVCLPKHNLYLIGYGKPSGIFGIDTLELDTKLLFEKLSEQKDRGEIIVDINEPAGKIKPIVITVTYPGNSISKNWKKIFYIDQATKLITRIEKFELKDNEFKLNKTLEFFDYNQHIDPIMFTLNDEISADTKVVNVSSLPIGMTQGNMADEEAVMQVSREFFEAVIAKNFSLAGQLCYAAPAFLIEKIFSDINILKILSVGPAYPDSDPDSNAIIGSCKSLIEIGGKYFELDASMIKVIKINKDSWMISGLATKMEPVQNTDK